MPACGSTNKESPAGAPVAGAGATAGVLEGVLTVVDVVGVVVVSFVAAALPRGVVGPEQPAIESARPAKRVSMMVADQIPDPFDRSISRPLIAPVAATPALLTLSNRCSCPLWVKLEKPVRRNSSLIAQIVKGPGSEREYS
jgi:hypothetical protein